MQKINMFNLYPANSNNYLQGSIYKSKYTNNNISFGATFSDKCTNQKTASKIIKTIAHIGKLLLAFCAGLLSAFSVFKFQNKSKQKPDSYTDSNNEIKPDIQIIKADNFQQEDASSDKIKTEFENDFKNEAQIEDEIKPINDEALQESEFNTDIQSAEIEPDAFDDSAIEFEKNTKVDNYHENISLEPKEPRSSDIEERIAKLKQSNVEISNGIAAKMIINALKSDGFKPYVSALNDNQLQTILSDRHANFTTLSCLFEIKKDFTPEEIERVSHNHELAHCVTELICNKPKNSEDIYYRSCIYRMIHTFDPDTINCFS